MPFIKSARGAQLFVQDTLEGRPVVFVHGWPLNSKMFEYQFMQMAPMGYRCIGVDLAGFGMSEKPWGEGSYTYEVFADDIRQVLSALDIDDVTLVGFSMGGAIAMRYLAKYRAWRVKRAVFMGAAAPSFTKREGYPHGKARSEVDAMIAQSHVDRPKLNAAFGRNLFKDEGSVSKEMAGWVHSISLEAAPHAALRCLEQLRDADLRADMAAVGDLKGLQVAIFHGTHDKVCSFDFAKVMKEGIPGSRLVEFTESGHALNLEEAQKTNQELAKFIGP